MTSILFVSANESAAWGASEELWSQTALRMALEGIRVAVSVKAWDQQVPALHKLEQAGCTVYRRREAPEFVCRPPYELPESERRASTIEAILPRLVIISQGDNYEGLGWMEECLRQGVAYSVIVNSASEYHWLRDPVSARLQKGYLGSTSSYFICQHNLVLTERQIASKLPNAKIIRFAYKVPYDVELEWPQGNSMRLACVARLDPETKGQDVLFDVMSMPKWRERPLHVTLYGNGNQLSTPNVLKALRESLALDNVTFAGYVSDIIEVWNNNHALVLPSRAEGLPAVIVEAMLCGRPAIVTNVAGNTEFVVDEVTGFVAEAPTVRCLDEAMERAWQARARWPDIGRTGRDAIRRLVPPDPVSIFVEELRQLL